MLSSFFRLSAVSPARQRALRGAAAAHLLLLAYGAWFVHAAGQGWKQVRAEVVLGALLVTAGVVEGAILIGWRLTQLPKSLALEFLLVTPLRAERVFLAESLTGIARLGLVTLTGLPILILLHRLGYLQEADALPLLLMPFTWGVVTGLAMVAWAYETAAVRRWGERLMIVGLLVYLAVGVLAGENLGRWLIRLPDEIAVPVLQTLRLLHEYNPFGFANTWFVNDPADVWVAAVALEAAALTLGGLLLARCATRLKGHFHDRHYRPLVASETGRRTPVSTQPLAWWAVRRVREYSGRINLWLAGGFCVLYATYILAGEHWPAWCGKRVFQLADGVGGIPVLAAALVVLGAVPAAFQYGLWDSNAQDRCRRLELLLLTPLEPEDYWRAAHAAAWERGRGYFLLAGILWTAGTVAGRLSPAAALVAAASAVLLWGIYFVLGFQGFSRGRNAHVAGLLLTLGLPLASFLLVSVELPAVAALFPPGNVWAAGEGAFAARVWGGAVTTGLLTLLMTRTALAHCDANLRGWYDQNSGRKMGE